MIQDKGLDCPICSQLAVRSPAIPDFKSSNDTMNTAGNRVSALHGQHHCLLTDESSRI